MQRSRVTSAANVSCLITPGCRRSGYNRASVWTLALFLKKGMGSDNTTAALLLKGSFCAAPSCLRAVGRVGRPLRIEVVVVVVGGGCPELPPPKLRQFLLVVEGKRAGQLLVMPNWGQTVWPGAAVRPCWTLCPDPLAQHRYYINYPFTGTDHEKDTGGTVANQITLQFSSNAFEWFKDDSAASTSEIWWSIWGWNPLDEDNIPVLYIRDVQKDAEEEGWLREHAAHQQSSQVQKGQRNLPASWIPNTMRTTWTGKTAMSPPCFKALRPTIHSFDGIYYHCFALSLLHLISVMTNTSHLFILLKRFIACGLGAQDTHCKHLLDSVKSESL